MTAADLHAHLLKIGLSVTVDGPTLIVGPRGLVTRELRERIAAAKPSLMRLIREADQAAAFVDEDGWRWYRQNGAIVREDAFDLGFD